MKKIISFLLALSVLFAFAPAAFAATAYTAEIVTPVRNGRVSVSQSKKKGETAYITAVASEGYTVDNIIVTKTSGGTVKVSTTSEITRFSFVMPASNVTVKVVFARDIPMPFVDVNKTDDCYEAVRWAFDEEITGGVDETHFAPKETVTRAQMITFLWRVAGKPTAKTESAFDDVSRESYYYTAVSWAVENKITEGTGENCFSPDDTLDRAAALTFLYRYKGTTTYATLQKGVNIYRDVNSRDYYYDAVRWAVGAQVLDDDVGDSFYPGEACRRSDTAVFLFRTAVGA